MLGWLRIFNFLGRHCSRISVNCILCYIYLTHQGRVNIYISISKLGHHRISSVQSQYLHQLWLMVLLNQALGNISGQIWTQTWHFSQKNELYNVVCDKADISSWLYLYRVQCHWCIYLILISFFPCLEQYFSSTKFSGTLLFCRYGLDFF